MTVGFLVSFSTQATQQRGSYYRQHATIRMSTSSQDQDCRQVVLCSILSCALRDHGWYSKRLERGGVELNYCGSPAANGTGFSFYSAEASQEEEQERRDKISAACKGKLATNKDHQWDEIMRSLDPTDEQVEALLGVKLTGSGKEQIILAITQIDAALGEKAKKQSYARTMLKKILVFLSQ